MGGGGVGGGGGRIDGKVRCCYGEPNGYIFFIPFLSLRYVFLVLIQKAFFSYNLMLL